MDSLLVTFVVKIVDNFRVLSGLWSNIIWPHGGWRKWINQYQPSNLAHTIADTLGDVSLLSGKYGHYFSLFEIKDKKNVVSCSLCAGVNFIHINE